MWTRRSLLASAAGAALGAITCPRSASARAPRSPMLDRDPAPPLGGPSQPLVRAIPSTGERIPAIGIGSWQTFDVADPATVQPVLARFLALGGRVIDSSPMYGRAEAAIGAMLAAIRRAEPRSPTAWLATKVWTPGKREGAAQMKRSLERLGASSIDLMQVHNLVDWRAQLASMRELKAAGTIRYVGVTHYSPSAFPELEQILRTERLDFVQLPYNATERAVEQRLLPLAAERGVAVLVMEPFASGALIRATRGAPLPAVAAELQCTSWPQLLLKFLLGHPAVTCPIPATSKVAHVEDNLRALYGPVPTAAQRRLIAEAVARAR
jgi:aryl-alcohol dehydrogenase-like predicted oxidoreductase